MPRRRLQHIYDLARTKSVCEGGDTEKNQDMMEEEEALKQTVQNRFSLIFEFKTRMQLFYLSLQAPTGCGRFQPKIRKAGLELTAEWSDKKRNDDSQDKKIVLTAERVLEVFKNISDEDCAILGMDPKFARPDWMIVTVLPVPPLPVRPAVVMHGSARNQVGRSVPCNW